MLGAYFSRASDGFMCYHIVPQIPRARVYSHLDKTNDIDLLCFSELALDTTHLTLHLKVRMTKNLIVFIA